MKEIVELISTAKYHTVVSDRMDRHLLDYCLEHNRCPIELRQQGKYTVYAVYTALSPDEAREKLQDLVTAGFTDVWVEVASLEKVA